MGVTERHHHDSAVHASFIIFPQDNCGNLIKLFFGISRRYSVHGPTVFISLNVESVKVTCANQNSALMSTTDLFRMVGNSAWQRKKET